MSGKGKSSTGKSWGADSAGCNGNTGGPDPDEDDDGVFPDFVLNSAISIIGTNGPNVVVTGSEADDTFLVTKTQVHGGGLSIDFSGVADLRIDVGTGRDSVTVLSTDPSVVTGVHRSEDVKTIPRRVNPVVSRNLLGHSGIVEHSVTSSDRDYDELEVQGLTTGILDDDGSFAYVHILEDEPIHIVSEEGQEKFSFFVIPTQIPEGTVVVSFQSPVDPQGVPYVLLNGGGPVISLTFVDDGEPQEVMVTFNGAVSPLKDGGTYLIHGTVITGQSTDERYIATRQSIKPVRVTLLPELLDDTISIFVVEPTGSTDVAEGEMGFNATYEILLRPCTEELANETAVVIRPSVPDQIRVDTDVIVGELWGIEDGCKATITVTAVDDDKEELQHFVSLFHWVRNVSSVGNTTEEILAAFEETEPNLNSNLSERTSRRRRARQTRDTRRMKKKKSSKGSESAPATVVTTPRVCPPPPLVAPSMPDAPTIGSDIVLEDGSVMTLPSIVARIYDDDTAGIIIQNSFRDISLVETEQGSALHDPRLAGSEYLVRLTQQPQDTVRLEIQPQSAATYPLTDETMEEEQVETVQVAVDMESLFFTESNWDEFQTIRIAPEFDDNTEGVDLFLMASQLTPLSQEPVVVPGTGVNPVVPPTSSGPSKSKSSMMRKMSSKSSSSSSSRRTLQRTLRRTSSSKGMMSSKGSKSSKSESGGVTCVPANCPPTVPDRTSAIQGRLEIESGGVDDVPPIAMPVMLPSEEDEALEQDEEN